MGVWIRKVWQKLRIAFLGLLASLGFVAVALAIPKTMSWSHPTERVDGTPLSLAEIAETRIYCDGAPPIVIAAPASSYVYAEGGTHTCYATTVDTLGLESDPSNTITFEVLPSKPSAPVFTIQ